MAQLSDSLLLIRAFEGRYSVAIRAAGPNLRRSGAEGNDVIMTATGRHIHEIRPSAHGALDRDAPALDLLSGSLLLLICP
jgi:hypothetical protein